MAYLHCATLFFSCKMGVDPILYGMRGKQPAYRTLVSSSDTAQELALVYLVTCVCAFLAQSTGMS